MDTQQVRDNRLARAIARGLWAVAGLLALLLSAVWVRAAIALCEGKP